MREKKDREKEGTEMSIITWIIGIVLVAIEIAAVRLALSCGIPTERRLRQVFGTPLEQAMAIRVSVALVIATLAAAASTIVGSWQFVAVGLVFAGVTGLLWIFRIAPGMGNGGRRWT